jgi:lysozyme
MSHLFINKIVDISHHQNPVDFKKVAAGGVLGVIHKSTHGMTGHDETHDDRRKEAIKAGLLWGSYHFGTGVSTGTDQANRFLNKTKPRPGDLLALDFEPNVDSEGHSMGSNMSLAQAREFVQTIQHATGWYPMIYGGDHLKNLLGDHNDSVIGQCPLWLAQYTKEGALPSWPKNWASWTLWQYTGDGVGGQPHTAAGIGGVCERDFFIGTETQLKDSWKWNLNHDDIGMVPPEATGPFVVESESAKILKAIAVGWEATFTMHLKDSNTLIRGTLSLLGPVQTDHYEWVATSGVNPFQGPDDLWKKDKGPMPLNPDTASGNHIETIGYVGNKVKYSHRILPEAVTDPITKITRSAFRVHFDGGDNGSAGCIALQKLADFEEFDKIMLDLAQNNILKIPLTSLYT